MTDDEIKDKLRLGDPEVMKWLFENYYTGLCTYASRFTKNKVTSEEIVQQSFFKLWEKRISLKINDSIIGYLFRMVKNNCLNYLKHQQIVNKYNEDYTKSVKSAEGSLSISQENGLSIYIAKELENKITTAIDKLPEQCREIFKMSRFEGLKHQEIADNKGVTIHTIQKQISIALSKLRIELAAYLSISILLVIKGIGEIFKIL